MFPWLYRSLLVSWSAIGQLLTFFISVGTGILFRKSLPMPMCCSTLCHQIVSDFRFYMEVCDPFAVDFMQIYADGRQRTSFILLPVDFSFSQQHLLLKTPSFQECIVGIFVKNQVSMHEHLPSSSVPSHCVCEHLPSSSVPSIVCVNNYPALLFHPLCVWTFTQLFCSIPFCVCQFLCLFIL